ncbi:hypothetical protein E8E15_007467 [Penicillium rubens]|nr:uncharacterized protein N7525_009609 [Penicillium rubens]KAF3027042.1 hypothetical protein E8E15_007467 [Penicillium rubens]KAJ5053292.1 hypothetical protein NUH16_010362 [Penicillium rubens]KAJ5831356.1 hypothetical protein N7525_009609 [Penicillium rubens]KZN86549.1 hypothetical protein EN45_050810 [Penicillium chrysogenum]
MKKIKKAVRRIKARASATHKRIRGQFSAIRERIRGRLSAKRKSNKARTSEDAASDVPHDVDGASEAPAPEVLTESDRAIEVAAGFAVPTVPHDSDQVIETVPTLKRIPHAYSDTPLHYVSLGVDYEMRERLLLQFGTEWESYENRFLFDMQRFPPAVLEDPQSPCPLAWLPLKIRAKIWKYAFEDGKDAVFLMKNGMVPKIPTAMRFVSLNWMSEAWFAYVNALSNRTLVLMDFPREAYVQKPCPVIEALRTVRLREVKLTLGDNDPMVANKRTRQFANFIAKQRNRGVLTVRTLVIELRKNWASSHFNELDLANLLTSGAFTQIERIRIHGMITSKRLDRLLERARHVAQVTVEIGLW